MKRLHALIATLALVLTAPAAESHAASIFFGFDEATSNGGYLDAFTPMAGGMGPATTALGGANSTAAKNSFFSALSGLTTGTETFESFMAGAGGPGVDLNLTFGGTGVTGILSGNGAVDAITAADVLAGRLHKAGRYPTSGEKYFDTNFQNLNVHTITFSEAVLGFGFYMTDTGDFDGIVQLTLQNGNRVTLIGSDGNGDGVVTQTAPDMPHPHAEPLLDVPTYNASLLYFGYIDLMNPITSISFSNTNFQTGQFDRFGLDDVTIAIRSSSTPVPEPASLSLMLVGGAAAAYILRRRRPAAA